MLICGGPPRLVGKSEPSATKSPLTKWWAPWDETTLDRLRTIALEAGRNLRAIGDAAETA